MTDEERKRLIAAGVMDDDNDTYPRVCETCAAEFPGTSEAARAAGWACGWDGWICPACSCAPTVH